MKASQTVPRKFRVIIKQVGTDAECEGAVDRALQVVAQAMRRRGLPKGGEYARRHLHSGELR